MPFPLRFTCPFLLASGSPRRRRLLDQIGLDFTATVSPADETIEGDLAPREVVRTLARRKARPVAADHPEALVLTADTVVAHTDEVLGKPEAPAHARRMLRRLSGTTHEVHTGFALTHARSDQQTTVVDTTEVSFATLTDREIAAYVESGSPMDKAGGYGIQDHTGPLFVEEIRGDYHTVVGLPLRRLYDTLKADFRRFLETDGD